VIKKFLKFQLIISLFLLNFTITAFFPQISSITIASPLQSKMHPSEKSTNNPKQGFVMASGQSLILNGSCAKFFGVNHGNLIWSFIWPDKIDENGYEVIEMAAKYNLAAIRFSAAGYYDWQTRTWLSDSVYYWTRYDLLLSAAKENGVYLIPSLLWNPKQFSDVVGENPSDVFFNGTKSNLLFRKYVTDIVSRYKDETTILMWELGNEWNLFVEPRTSYYNITQLRSFINETVRLIRSVDINHIIGSGMAAPPNDINPTMDEALKHFVLVNDFVDVASIHTYPHDQNGLPYGITETQYIQMFLDKAQELNKPLMIGEFGSNEDYDPSGEFSLEVLTAAFNNNIVITLIWEWFVSKSLDDKRLRWNIDPFSNPFMTRVLQQFSLASFLKLKDITIKELRINSEKTVILYEINNSGSTYFLYTYSNSTTSISELELSTNNITFLIYGVEGWNRKKEGFFRIVTTNHFLGNRSSILLDSNCVEEFRNYSNETYFDVELSFVFNPHILKIVDNKYCTIAEKTVFPFLMLLITMFYLRTKKKKKKNC